MALLGNSAPILTAETLCGGPRPNTGDLRRYVL
jgi:hypothetical protein